MAKIIEKCYEDILNKIDEQRKEKEMENKNTSKKYVVNSSECTVNLKNGLVLYIKDNEEPKLLCPKIIDVNIIVPNKVVVLTFADGTKEKSVCNEPDVFSLERAISICISKKLMGGSSTYNNTVKHGMKVYEDKLRKEAAEKAEQERIVKKREKRLAYKEQRAAKRAETEKERQIEIQKEAYLRAMKDFDAYKYGAAETK